MENVGLGYWRVEDWWTFSCENHGKYDILVAEHVLNLPREQGACVDSQHSTTRRYVKNVKYSENFEMTVAILHFYVFKFPRWVLLPKFASGILTNNPIGKHSLCRYPVTS